MEYLMYGFEANIRIYEVQDLFGWLLVVALMHFLAGNFIAGRQVRNNYMRLVRLGCFSKWWHRLCIQVLCLCLALTAAAFSVSLLARIMRWGMDLDAALGEFPLPAFFLFLLNFCFLTTFQMLVINLEQGEKLSFLLMAVVEVLSLYGWVICLNWVCWMPGSWKMYCRSDRFVPTGYSVTVISMIQFLWIVLCCRIGYKWLDRRR